MKLLRDFSGCGSYDTMQDIHRIRRSYKHGEVLKVSLRARHITKV
ncbi:MAG: hypothetical protein AB7G48_09650 [Nitrospiraceae bacterium]